MARKDRDQDAGQSDGDHDGDDDFNAAHVMAPSTGWWLRGDHVFGALDPHGFQGTNKQFVRVSARR
ncbi:MAG: hypothetical protein R2693_06895 [Nocardioidaceae bacterium]